MNKFTFHRGLHLNIDSKEFVVLRRLSDRRLQFENVQDGEILTLNNAEVLAKYAKNEIRFVATQDPDGQPLDKPLAEKIERELSALSEPLLNKVKRQLLYVKAVELIRPLGIAKARIEQAIKQVAAKIADTDPPSWTTAYRWWRSFISAGRDPRALIPAWGKRGNHKPRHQPEVYAAVRQARDEVYLTQDRSSVDDVAARATCLIDDENRLRGPDDQLPIPRRKFLYKIIHEIDPYDRMVARYGKRAADIAFRVSMRGPRPTRPLERVEMDHTKADIFVIHHKYLLPLGRPWITTCLDVATKCPLGFYVGFEPPSTLSVMGCLKHAILPKTYVKDLYPAIQNTWDCHGIMESLVVDNDLAFHSMHLERACLRHGIDIQFTKVKIPWYKGSEERFQKTLNHDLLHGKPGTTFSNIFERADYDPAKHAVITLDVLIEVLHRWIIDVYCQRPQGKGKDRDIPADRWAKAIVAVPPALPASAADLDVTLGDTVERKVWHYGIELNGLLYNHESLGGLRHKHGKKLSVTVVYSPGDLSRIFVQEPGADRYIEVPSNDPAYTTGLALWTHKVICRYAKLDVNRRLNVIALMRAKDDIRRIMSTGLSRVRYGTRQRAARYESIDSRSVLTAQKDALGETGTSTPSCPELIDQPEQCDSTPQQAPKEEPNNAAAKRRPTVQAPPDPDDGDLPDFEADYGLPRVDGAPATTVHDSTEPQTTSYGKQEVPS